MGPSAETLPCFVLSVNSSEEIPKLSTMVETLGLSLRKDVYEDDVCDYLQSFLLIFLLFLILIIYHALYVLEKTCVE